MNYPVLIMKSVEGKNGYQLSVIDLPGCQVYADTIDKGLAALNETIAAHLSILVEYGEQIPHANSIEYHMNSDKYQSPIWAVIEFDVVPYMGKSHKINVTLPELLIKKIDDRVNKSSNYKTRSGFIASACLNELNIKE